MPDTKLQREIARRHEAATALVIPTVRPGIDALGLRRVGTLDKALPGDLTLITVTGQFIDLTGTPCVGTVTFKPSYSNVLKDDAAPVSIVPITLTATLDGTGAISINLPATDDPDIIPMGWSYTVTYSFVGFSQSFSIVVPYDGGNIDLTTVSPVSPVTGLDAFVTFGQLTIAVEAGIEAVIVISDTPPADHSAIWIDITT